MKKAIKIIVILLLILMVLLAGIAVFALHYIDNLGEALDPSSTATLTVTIESGSTTADIGQLLVDNGIIESVDEFKLWSRINGYDSSYQAGIYTLSPSMSYEEIATIIVSGQVDTFTFTIPEGYTLDQVADALSEMGLVDRDVFMDLLVNGDFDYDFLEDAQDNENRLEGYLFPETYTLPVGSTEEDIINVMLAQFQQAVDSEAYAKAEALGYTMNEIVIIASIIERESMVDEERPLVASVIYNRLSQGMLLQMCSTIQYILGEPKAVLTTADTQIQSPYNTYLYAGLPPGPICSPGIASINAALNPEDTDYLYFVLSEKLDGTSNFSSDYNQFLRDKNAYYQAYEAAN